MERETCVGGGRKLFFWYSSKGWLVGSCVVSPVIILWPVRSRKVVGLCRNLWMNCRPHRVSVFALVRRTRRGRGVGMPQYRDDKQFRLTIRWNWSPLDGSRTFVVAIIKYCCIYIEPYHKKKSVDKGMRNDARNKWLWYRLKGQGVRVDKEKHWTFRRHRIYVKLFLEHKRKGRRTRSKDE